MKLFFCQLGCPIRGPSWPKNSFITHILFELCLFWYLAQSTSFWDTLYVKWWTVFKKTFGKQVISNTKNQSVWISNNLKCDNKFWIFNDSESLFINFFLSRQFQWTILSIFGTFRKWVRQLSNAEVRGISIGTFWKFSTITTGQFSILTNTFSFCLSQHQLKVEKL